MAIDEKIKPEDKLSRIIGNVNNCFSRMDEESYDWDNIHTTLNQAYEKIPEENRGEFLETYQSALSLIDIAINYKPNADE